MKNLLFMATLLFAVPNVFAGRKHRYVVDLNLGHKFKGKERVVKQLLEEKMINAETAKAMLGYNLGKE